MRPALPFLLLALPGLLLADPAQSLFDGLQRGGGGGSEGTALRSGGGGGAGAGEEEVQSFSYRDDWQEEIRGEMRLLRAGRERGARGVPVYYPQETMAVVVEIPERSRRDDFLYLGFKVDGRPRLVKAEYRGDPVNAYAFVARVSDVVASRRERGRSYAAFRTTESQDAATFRSEVRRVGGGGGIPRTEISFHDQEGDGSVPEGQGAVNGAELFEAGGVELVPLSAYTPRGVPVARSVLAVAGEADWIYYSGHYPYTSGALVNGEDIDPFRIEGERWREHLELLLFASCYAVDVNAPGAETISHGRGVHGSLWWRKFQGTLLGYRALAPSHPGDSEVIRRFLRRVARSDVDPGDRQGYSRMLAEAWMHVNMHELNLAGAAAIDSEGRYYYLRSKEVNLRGVPVRGSYRWAIADRSIWEPQNEELQQEYRMEQAVFAPIRSIQWEDFGGRPPRLEQVLRSREFQDQVRSQGLDPRDPTLVEKVQAFLDYETHIFYDVPRPDYYQKAIRWLADRNDSRRRIQVDDVYRHFTATTRRSKAELAPRNVVERLLFQEYAWRAAVEAAQRGRNPSARDLARDLGQDYPVDQEAYEFLQYLERYFQST